jgi:hypothetical protein
MARICSAGFQQLIRKARDARVGGFDAWSVQSTGEKVAVALVLNRADWLDKIGYTIPEAIDRCGPSWVAMIPDVARVLADEEEAHR